MSARVQNLSQAATAFDTFAQAEGTNVPTYARICRIIAADPALHGLLLEAPTGQRLAVLLLAALHYLLLTTPEHELSAWYPSVSGHAAAELNPAPALRDLIERNRPELLHLLRSRQVQTNEVNRCCAWWLGLGSITAGDARPIVLIELGASAGLNLQLDRYGYQFSYHGSQEVVMAGVPTALVQLGTEFRIESEGGFALEPAIELYSEYCRGATKILPEIVWRAGLDVRPIKLSNPDDCLWLKACVWSEQLLRFQRLTAAVDTASEHPLEVVAGDLRSTLGQLLRDTAPGCHVVLLCSWVLAYLPRSDRVALHRSLEQAGGQLALRGSRLSMLTLESAEVVPWVRPNSRRKDVSAEKQHASLLAVTNFGELPPSTSRILASCQAHMLWAELLSF